MVSKIIAIRLYEQKAARPEAGLFDLLFGYFLVRSAVLSRFIGVRTRK
jgi:hypothetical protein